MCVIMMTQHFPKSLYLNLLDDTVVVIIQYTKVLFTMFIALYYGGL